MQTQTQPRFTKRAMSIATFNALLPKRKVLGNTAFRQTLIKTFQAEHGVTVPAACTMYNFAKKKAEHLGLTAPFGKAKVLGPVALAGDKWKVVDLTTTYVVSFHATRAKARTAKASRQVVVKL